MCYKRNSDTLERDALDKFKALHIGTVIRCYLINQEVDAFGGIQYIKEQTYRIEYFSVKDKCTKEMEVTVY